MAFRVGTQVRNGRRVHTLHDDSTGASAAVLPSFGFNLFDLRLPAGDAVRRVIIAEDGWEENPKSPGRNGIPVLFPFPNRIANARYSFEGKTYDLKANNGPNAIHGFAIDAPWDVISHEAGQDGASIVGRYHLAKHTPEATALWPSDAVLEIRYTLAGRRLRLDATISNPTANNLPFGFGIHPYFRLPLDPSGNPDQTSVVLPAERFWVLKDFIPTGEVEPVDPRLDFRKGQPMSGLKLDDVLTGLSFEDDRAVCRLVDRDLGATVRVSFDRGFRELVVYTPPGPDHLISLEPYTQTTDAINLAGRGIDGGLRVLGHGEQARLSIWIETE